MKRSEIDTLLNGLGVEIDESKKKEFTDSIMKINGEDMNKKNTEIETVKNDLKVKEGVIEELNSKIKEKDSVDIEKIKEESFNEGKAEGSKEFENFKKTSALKSALSGYKAKDVELLQKMLDNEKLEYEEKDGNYTVKGLDDQVKSIKESHSYLFDEEKTQTKTVDLGGQHQGTIDNSPKTLREALNEKYNK